MEAKNLKLMQAMKSLSALELKRLDLFLRSPYFSQKPNILSFFNLLKPAYPDFDDGDVDFKAIFHHLFPGEQYEDNKIRVLRKELLRLVLKFLEIEESQKDPINSQLTLLFALGKKTLPTFHVPLLEKLERSTQAYPFQDSYYFWTKFHLEDKKIEFQTTHGSRTRHKDYRPAMGALQNLYMIEVLRYCSAIAQVHGKESEQLSEVGFLSSVLEFCRSTLENLPLIVRTYWHIFMLTVEEETAFHYDWLSKTILQGNPPFKDDDFIHIYSFLINHSNHEYRRGKLESLHDMFAYYKDMLGKGLLFEGAILSTNNYKNITTLGLRTQNLTWTKEFIHTYKDHIDPSYREGVFNYNLAHYYSYTKEYTNALKHLRQVEFIDPFYKISYYMLLLKIYYECNEIEAFLALANTFRTFIRRRKNLNENQKLAYLNFARFARAIFMIRAGKKHNAQIIHAKINGSEAIIEKQWLLQKLADILPWQVQ